jgi:hypothetical protein
VALTVTSPSLLILGTDAVLAAGPATPVQLAHACLAAGYRSVVPASWGDEIVARRALDAIEYTNGPLVLSCCPFVTRRLGRHADDIGSLVLSCVSPPVATAAYLRALYAPASVRITYVGACPAGGHASIDAWLTPAELFADLVSKGIQLGSQPREFDSVLPPDRRRHFSEPGGAPSSDALRRATGAPELVELEGHDFAIDLAQALLGSGLRLIDAAPALGCVCSGATSDVPPQAARARVRSGEPPRAPSPVVDHDVDLVIDIVTGPPNGERAHASPPSRHGVAAVDSPAILEPEDPQRPAQAMAATAASALGHAPLDDQRRRSPAGSNRAVIGAMPQSRSSGRQLPRAYVARRRSSPKGIRQSGVRKQIEVMAPYREQRATPTWIWFAGIGTVLVAVASVLIVLASS